MASPFVLPTLPRWRLLLTASGVLGLRPDGQQAFATDDCGEVLDALDPADPQTESVALCAAALLGISPPVHSLVTIIAPATELPALATLVTLHGFTPSATWSPDTIAAYVLADWPTPSIAALLRRLPPHLPLIMVHPTSLPEAIPTLASAHDRLS